VGRGLILLLLFSTPAYVGEAYEILTSLPPLASVWHPPKMPVPSKELKAKKEKELQSLGICWGSDVAFFNAGAETNNGPSNLLFINWRGGYHITIEMNYSGNIRNIWLDIDNDGIADEHYFGMKGLQNEYGKNAWLCYPIKRVLDYWR
jgi:hypothetical protein